jgi:4-amino-4-deoxy-L-arabinose transferase-like glycosyltransferase
MFDPPPKPAPPLLSRLWVQVVLTLAAACLAQLPWLGSSGLSQSEGHRAIPGWTMLERGNWIVPHLFEQPYLRKPPGMPWAVALYLLGPWRERVVRADGSRRPRASGCPSSR